jgi:competence protein ComEC
VESLLVLGVVCVFLLPARQTFEVDMLDVGQGDGIFFQSEEGVTCFVDGGSTTVSSVGTYRILPFLKYKGIRKIDYWFVSHTDEDHVSGLKEALEAGYQIKNLVFSETMKEDNEALEALCQLAEEQNCNLVFLSQGDKITTDTMTVTCYYPPKEAVFTGVNENCLVFLLTYQDFQMLFTGDIAAEQETWLLEQGIFTETTADIDVLKVAHHGSKYSTGSEFLQQLSPRYGVISAGEGNSYGHPAADTLERLEEQNIITYCTMDTGRIRMTLEGDELQVERYRE